MLFQYSAEIMRSFSNTVGGLISIQGLTNGPTPDGLKEKYLVEQQSVLARIGDTPLSELPTLNAWRQVFRQFGVNPTKTRCAPEALLRRLTKQGDIPFINTLVDIGNLVSIRYALPVAVMDCRDVQGLITVDFSNGTERFTELGSDEPIHPEVGEVVFADETGMVMARRWCWRQSVESAAREDTRDVIICIEAHHDEGLRDATQGVVDLLSLLEEFAGGSEAHSAILSAGNGTAFYPA